MTPEELRALMDEALAASYPPSHVCATGWGDATRCPDCHRIMETSND